MLSSLANKARRTYWLGRYLGPRWLAYRGLYAIQQRTGYMERRLPASTWDEQPLHTRLVRRELADAQALAAFRNSQPASFFFKPTEQASFGQLLCSWDTDSISPIWEAQALAEGQLRFFGGATLPVGSPPKWTRNAVSGREWPPNQHWSRIDEFAGDDIKVIWEPNRFSFAYAFVRAYWRTGDERWPELFWQWLEDWKNSNHPQYGPNWKCGQETSLRVMAWCFALYGFAKAKATSAERLAMLVQMIAVSAERINANLRYALSQRNNHGISEGNGLWTIGLLFPELSLAETWRETGRAVLEDTAKTLIYKDGSFTQPSFSYHRLMLHNFVWAIRLGQLNEQPLSAELQANVRAAGEFLYQLIDLETGRTPHYGPIDGSLILPLDNCPIHDYRSVSQVCTYLADGTRRFEDGMWDESLFWLFGAASTRTAVVPQAQIDLDASIGGYYTIRSPEGFAFTRCATLINRPAQADMLHVDIWWRGINIARDAGVYSYNAEEPWRNAFETTAIHNTVTVDGLDQMERIGRFLWLPWLNADVQKKVRFSPDQIAYWEGSHNGYQRLPASVMYRRSIVALPEDTWLIIDTLTSSNVHTYQLHWLLEDAPHSWLPDLSTVQLETPKGTYKIRTLADVPNAQSNLTTADNNSPHAWYAPTYQVLSPALSLTTEVTAKDVRFYSLLGEQWQLDSVANNRISIRLSNRRVDLLLSPTSSNSPVVNSIELYSTTNGSLPHAHIIDSSGI